MSIDTVELDKFAEAIKSTPLFADLQTRVRPRFASDMGAVMVHNQAGRAIARFDVSNYDTTVNAYVWTWRQSTPTPVCAVADVSPRDATIAVIQAITRHYY